MKRAFALPWSVVLVLLSISLTHAADDKPDDDGLLFRRRKGYLSDRGTNVVVQDNRARLYYAYKQLDDKPIVMETEMASRIDFEPGRGTTAADKTASGGMAIASVTEMDFDFEVVTPGTYTAWYRASFPRKGNWNHTESMDGGPLKQQVDSEGQVLDTWMWVKGPSYKLTAGKHQWRFGPQGWMGGAGIDKVMLTLDDKEPEGMGPEALPSALPLVGTVLSRPAEPSCLAKWVRIGVNTQGKVDVEASADGGQTFKPVDDQGWLKHLEKSGPLVLRMTLRGTKEQPVPRVSGITLEYLVKPADPIVLENELMKLVFSGETGGLVDIVNKTTKTSYMTGGDPGDFLALRALEADRSGFGRLFNIPFEEFTFKGATRGVNDGDMTLRWSIRGGDILPSLCVQLLPGGLARLSLSIDNRSKYTIAKTMNPTLTGLRIGDSEKDDYLFTPANSGAILKYPARFKVPRRIFTRRRLVYPGNAWMCWMSVWDETGGGLYMATYDKKYRFTQLHFAPGGAKIEDAGGNEASVLPPKLQGYPPADKPGTSITLAFEKTRRIPAHGGLHHLPEVVLGVHQGDWHWGADRYREWAESWMEGIPAPAWLRDMPGITNAHGGHTGNNYVDYFNGRPYGGARTWTLEDPPYPFVAFWAQMVGCETAWARQPLHQFQGTPEQFANAVQKHHERGHRVTAYILPTRMTPAHHRNARRIGSVPRVLYPDEELPREGFYNRIGERYYDGRHKAPMTSLGEGAACLGNPEWRDYIAHWVLDKYMDQYGTDGMYLDGAGLYTKECACLDHGHDYGEWTRGACRLYRRLCLEGQARRPGAVFMGEGMSAVENRYLHLSLYYIDNAPEVYRYVFPENEGFMMGRVTHRGKDTVNDLGYEDWFDFDTILGLKTWAKDMYYEYPYREQFEQMAAFREQLHQFQNRSRFVDNVGLTVSERTVIAKLFVKDDARGRGALVVSHNPKRIKGVKATVAAERAGSVRSAWLLRYDATWHKVPVVKRDGAYHVELPEDRLSAVVLVQRAAPQINISHPAPVAPGQRGVVTVHVRNLEATPIEGTLTLDQPDTWQVDAVAVKLATGKTGVYEVGYVPSLDVKPDVYDLSVVMRETDGSTTDKVTPCGVCRPVLARLDWSGPDTLQLTLTSKVSKAVSGRATIEPPLAVTVTDNDQAYTLAPGQVKTLTFRLNGLNHIRGRHPVKAVVSYPGGDNVAFEHVQQPLPNGDFELCLAGDGKPDYWNYEVPRHGTFYRLDESVKKEGRYSVRIDGSKKNGYTMLRHTFFRPRPGARYMLSVSIRRSIATPQGYLNLYCNYVPKGKDKPFTWVQLGRDPEAKADTWQTYTAEFTAPPVKAGWNVLLFNRTKGEGVIWFDDIRIEEIPEKK